MPTNNQCDILSELAKVWGKHARIAEGENNRKSMRVLKETDVENATKLQAV